MMRPRPCFPWVDCSRHSASRRAAPCRSHCRSWASARRRSWELAIWPRSISANFCMRPWPALSPRPSSCGANGVRRLASPVRHARGRPWIGAARSPCFSHSASSCLPSGSSRRYEGRSSIDPDLSVVRRRQDGDDADGRLPIFLRMHGMQDAPETEARRLLRVLLVRFDAVSTHSARRPSGLLRRVIPLPGLSP